jgi:hypothetical protein
MFWKKDKDWRIAELERVVERMDRRIDNLTNDLASEVWSRKRLENRVLATEQGFKFVKYRADYFGLLYRWERPYKKCKDVVEVYEDGVIKLVKK